MKKILPLIIIFLSLIFISAESRTIGLASGNTNSITATASGPTLKLDKSQKSEIYSIAYSPDGRYIAATVNPSAKKENTEYKISLWDARTGELYKTLGGEDGHTGKIWSVAFSPNGKRLVSGSEDKTIKIWDVETGKVVRTLIGHEDWVSFVTYDLTGAYITSGSRDKTLKVWDAKSGKEYGNFTGHTANIASIAYSARYMASASWDSMVKIYNTMGQLQVIYTLEGHSDRVFAVSWSPDGKRLASGSVDRTVKIWNIDELDANNENAELLELTIEGFGGSIWDVKFSPDGKRLAACSDDGIVRIFDSESGNPLAVLKGHNAPVRYVEWSPDGKRLASGANDASIKLWDMEKYEGLLTMVEDSDGNWLSWIPEGYFVGNDGGLSNLKFAVQGAEYLPDQVFESFYNPRFVSAKIQTNDLQGYISEDEEILEIYQVVKESYIPRVELKCVRDTEDKRKVKITVNVTDKGGGIGCIRLNINGRYFYLSEGEDTRKGQTVTKEYETFLLGKRKDGERKIGNDKNIIKACAWDRENRMRGREVTESLEREGEPKDPRLWVFTVACDKYSSGSLKDLNTTVLDANGVVQSFLKNRGSIYSDVIVRQLWDTDVTFAKLVSKFDEIAGEVMSDDVFVFFIAGHGMASDDGKEYYYFPSDFRCDSDDDLEEAVKNYAISGNQLKSLLGKIKAVNTLVLMDTCFSGAFIGDGNDGNVGGQSRTIGVNKSAIDDSLEQEVTNNSAMEHLSRTMAWATISATSADQESWERNADIRNRERGDNEYYEYDSHGIFSYYCMRGLELEADNDGDSRVTVTELAEYVRKKVSEGSQSNPKMEFQMPRVQLNGTDFVLTGECVENVGKEFYEQGVALEKAGEYEQAKKWYEYAGEKGNSDAKAAIKELKKKDEIIAQGECGAQGDNVTWTLTAGGTLTISGAGRMRDGAVSWGYEDNIQSVVIEDNVTSIGANAFSNCSSLTKIKIPNSVKTIGSLAFYCTGLTEIKIPYGVTNIDDGTFSDCTRLTKIEIPNTVLRIGNFAFSSSGLQEIMIPDSVITIGSYAFFKCEKLVKINVSPDNPNYSSENGILFDKEKTTLLFYPRWKKEHEYVVPKSVLHIAYGAFACCNGLTKVEIPSSVTYIGNAFHSCEKLKTIEVSKTNPNYSSINGVLFDKNKTTLFCYPKGKKEQKYIIPNSVKNIAVDAFALCDQLTEVVIPNSVTNIEDEAFWGCSALAKLEIPSTVTSIGTYAFAKCHELTKIEIPNFLRDIEPYTFKGCTKLTEVKISDSVISINDNAFEGCTELKKIDIPINVTSIGFDAFKDCTKLTEVKILNSMININEDAFEDCSEFIEIEIANNAIYLNKNDFKDCDELTELEIPNNVTYIDRDILKTFPKLTEIKIPASVIYIDCEAFNMCEKLSKIEVSPDNPRYSSMDGILFDKKRNILLRYPIGKIERKFVVPDTVMSIGEAAFKDCKLIEIKIPNSVTYIGDAAFYYCEKLEKIEMPNCVTEIRRETFSGCERLTEIKIPDSVVSIREAAFSGCEELTKADIPNRVAIIYATAYSHCYKLKELNIPNSVLSLDIFNYAEASNFGNAKIKVSSTNLNYSSEDGVLFDKGKTILLFYQKSKMESEYVIPNSVMRIGTGAFDCENLSTLIMDSTIPPAGYDIGISQNCMTILVPQQSVEAYKTDEYWSEYADRIFVNAGDINEIKNRVIAQGECGAEGDNVTWTLAANGLFTISGTGEMKDYGYNDELPWASQKKIIKKVTVEKGVKNIGARTFSDCYNLTGVAIQDSVTTIGDLAFYMCNSLTEIIIPDSVASIDRDAFRGCDSLAGIKVVTDNKNYADIKGVLFNKEKTELICYPKGKTDSKYVIPDSVDYIGICVFSGCCNLVEVIIPNSVTNIDCNAFEFCDNLVEIILPDSVTSISTSTFSDCSSLSRVIIPNSVTSIGHFAFSRCRSLTEIVIPSSVTTIYDGVFSDCDSLATIVMNPATPPKGDDPILLLSNCKQILVPPESVDLYKSDEIWGKYADIIFPNPNAPKAVSSSSFPSYLEEIGAYKKLSGYYGTQIGGTYVTVGGFPQTIKTDYDSYGTGNARIRVTTDYAKANYAW